MRTLFLDADDEPVDDAGEIMKLLKLWPPDHVLESFRALDRTDSLTVDPHKLGDIPYPCGTVLVRNGRVRDLVTFDAPYIFDSADGSDERFIGRHIWRARSPERRRPRAGSPTGWFP